MSIYKKIEIIVTIIFTVSAVGVIFSEKFVLPFMFSFAILMAISDNKRQGIYAGDNKEDNE